MKRLIIDDPDGSMTAAACRFIGQAGGNPAVYMHTEVPWQYNAAERFKVLWGNRSVCTVLRPFEVEVALITDTDVYIEACARILRVDVKVSKTKSHATITLSRKEN